MVESKKDWETGRTVVVVIDCIARFVHTKRNVRKIAASMR